MPHEITFDESGVEPIVGTNPSPYTQVVTFDESDVEPIIGRVSPYQEVITFDEATVEPIIGSLPSSYTSTVAHGDSGLIDPNGSPYTDSVAFPQALVDAFVLPKPISPYGSSKASSAVGQSPSMRQTPSSYGQALSVDKDARAPVIGRVPGAYDNVTTPPAGLSVPDPPLLMRGPTPQGTISWELQDAWGLPRPSTNAAIVTPAQRQVLSWLQSHRDKIVQVERNRKVDRRAIAGAIAWEALENTMWPGSLRAVGPGKVHARSSVVHQVEAAGYIPKQTDADRAVLLQDPDHAIDYIGAIMQAQTDIASQAGFDISHRPDVLTNEYNWQDLEQWRDHLKRKLPGSPLEAGTPMGQWTRDNLWYLEMAVGSPDPAAVK